MSFGFIGIFNGFTFVSTGDKSFMSELSELGASAFCDRIASFSDCFLAKALASTISRRIASAFSSLIINNISGKYM